MLILDEPSSSLTTSEIRVLLNIIKALKAKGVACVYISHKLDEVAEICDTISVIRDGVHVATQPMGSLNVERIIAMMVGREIGDLYPREPHEIGEVVLEASHITCFDPTNPSRRKVKDVSFHLRRGEILGIAGLVGAGRTELVSTLFGAIPANPAARSDCMVKRSMFPARSRRSNTASAWCRKTASTTASCRSLAWAGI